MRRAAAVSAAIALSLSGGALLLGSCARSSAPGNQVAPAIVASAPSARTPATAGTPTSSAARVRPIGLSIPRLGVRSGLERLKVGRDGELQAPRDPDSAGWYSAGAVPGDLGPAVIAGHLDSRTGPAIFWRLGALRPGDRVEVGRDDGTTARFRVLRVTRVPQDSFPTNAVYGPTPDRALRLITCGGSYDRVRGRYRDNVVVYALAV